ncbi:hypothetical protein B0187_02720 [Haemophilus paracuniculus]|uniref:Lipoprotein n=1 Tax=Haemophilus paracuniculus TaxID=734 RepID=A0A1T0ATE7_9PAST|nr:hypothetical protein [Haemophilus paracuniculus]OOR99738.1 hypothetical protein B0187_02720 [Haemophilus paracuniculus]
MMKKVLSTLALSATLVGCSQSAQPTNDVIVGGEKDQYGCLPSTGASYSFLKKECVQVFNVADISLENPSNKGSAVYVILSTDKSQAEVFATDLPDNTILQAVKGGYASQDGKVRLIKQKKGWKIYK